MAVDDESLKSVDRAATPNIPGFPRIEPPEGITKLKVLVYFAGIGEGHSGEKQVPQWFNLEIVEETGFQLSSISSVDDEGSEFEPDAGNVASVPVDGPFMERFEEQNDLCMFSLVMWTGLNWELPEGVSEVEDEYHD